MQRIVVTSTSQCQLKTNLEKTRICTGTGLNLGAGMTVLETIEKSIQDRRQVCAAGIVIQSHSHQRHRIHYA
jgi:hypothetical protein